jgi:arsenate reductase
VQAAGLRPTTAGRGGIQVVTLYGIRNCDTIRKARAWLDDRGIEYRFHDYKTAGVERAQLEHWARDVGWQALLNRAGTTFRRLPDSQKSVTGARDAIELMLAHPSLIKRPVLTRAGRVVVGFSPHIYETLLS